MKDFRHIVHLAIVFVIVISGFLVARAYLKPSSYGKIGRYRAASVDETKALPIQYAGKIAQNDCATCHQDQRKEVRSSKHQNIHCETCHGPLAQHITDPTSQKPRKPTEDEIVGFCLRCHEMSLAKPLNFPQVKLMKHYPDMSCVSCHKPHAPKI